MKAVAALPDVHLQRLVLENVSDIIVITDLDFKVQSWNRIAEQFYGFPAASAIGRYMNELVRFTFHNTTQSEALQTLLLEKIWKGEVSFTSPGGERFSFLQTVKYVTDEEGNAVGIMAMGRNVTEQKRAEVRLAESEQFYRALIADSLDVVLLLNHQGTITFSSPSVQALLGYAVDEVQGTSGFGYIHPEDLAWALQSFEKEVEENPEIKFIIVRLLKKDGDWLWCMVRGKNMLNTPHIASIAVFIHDDTQRKQASDALKQSEKHFRTLIRDLQVGVLLQDAAGKILLTNNIMTQLFDLTEEQILGGKIWEMYTDVIYEDGTRFLVDDRPSFKAMRTHKLVKDVVMGVLNKNKTERIWILVSADPVVDSEGRLLNIVCSFTDITERKKLEKKSTAEKMAHQRQLAQATIDGQERERLETGLELHDNIGQQLTSIKLFLDLAKTTANVETANLIAMSLKGVTAVIDEVRAMSRSLVPPTLKDFGFVDSVNDLIESLRTTQPITFTLTYCNFDEEGLPDNKKLALFRIIQEQLNNILKYAGAKNVTIALRGCNSEVGLTITDDGAGFDPGKIRRGLGLSNIINRSELLGGRAEITAAPDRGCTLNVHLPHKAASDVCESLEEKN